MDEKEKKYPIEEKNETQVVAEPASAYLARSRRYSYADYRSWTSDRRWEIYDGVLYDLFSAPTVVHARLSTAINALMAWFIKKRKGKCEVFHAPFDVRLPKNGETADDKIYTVLQPDICVICDPGKLDHKGCIGAPDLVVEIQSPSTAKRDLNEKFKLYEEAGVKEYWVVFPKEGITVFLLQENGQFDEGTPYIYEAKVPSTVLKGLEIDLEELFAD
jgi:Uma2 family endonuclease